MVFNFFLFALFKCCFNHFLKTRKNFLIKLKSKNIVANKVVEFYDEYIIYIYL